MRHNGCHAHPDCREPVRYYWHDAGPFGAGTFWSCRNHVPFGVVSTYHNPFEHAGRTPGACLGCNGTGDGWPSAAGFRTTCPSCGGTGRARRRSAS